MLNGHNWKYFRMMNVWNFMLMMAFSLWGGHLIFYSDYKISVFNTNEEERRESLTL